MRSANERSSTARPSEKRRLETGLAITPESSLEAAVEAQNLPLERAYFWERKRPQQLFLTQPFAGGVRHWTRAQTMNEARRMAAYLHKQDWPPGSRVVILAKNSAWWIMAELAIWMSGHVTVPIFTSLTVESARQLFDHSAPVACFLGSLDNLELLPENVSPELPCIRFPNAPVCPGVDWESAVSEHEPIQGNPVRAADELATIIYTSGTTGSPKGVMHRFSAFPYFVKAVTQVTGPSASHRVLSYLPLAHIAERALTWTTALSAGWHMFFCESAATFLADLKRARPTIFFSVPRLYTKFQAGVLEKIPQRRLDWLLRIPLLKTFVRRRVLNQLGLGAVRFAASGSAPLTLDLLLWFRRLGLPLTEGYGTTETGITHTAPDGEGRPGTAGRSAPGVVTRISSEGEVLVKSPMNMLGYFKDSASTRAAFTPDGFIRTGDLGTLDEDGWLRLSGRIKEQFKTSKGKYVSPTLIESMLNADSAVESSLVLGSGLSAPIAVVILSAEARAVMLTEAGRGKLARSFENLLEATNARLAPHERLQHLVLSEAKWSIETGFLTPTLKLKRFALEAYYAPFILQWTEQKGALIWQTA